nr:hypothetical protein [Paenibacillus bovis]
MKIKRSLIQIIILSFMISLVVSANGNKANAAVGYQGYAVFRDGAIGGINWHAGLMDKGYVFNTDAAYPVTHIAGFGDIVELGTWKEFLNGKTAKGVYEPKTYPGSKSAYRDLFVATGRTLTTENISYNAFFQVNYGAGTSTYIYPKDITSMRCDGVVEYIYEYHGARVFGSSAMWDVSKRGINKDHHGMGNTSPITPITQVNYLSLVKTGAPTP